MHSVFAQSAISYVASIIPIVSVRTVRNWGEITFRIVPVLYVESSEATTTRTVFAPSVTRVDNDQVHLAQRHWMRSLIPYGCQRGLLLARQ